MDWDAAVLGVVSGLRDLGYCDAYRVLHGYAAKEPSWTWKQIAGHGGGWRIDSAGLHLLFAVDLRPRLHLERASRPIRRMLALAGRPDGSAVTSR